MAVLTTAVSAPAEAALTRAQWSDPVDAPAPIDIRRVSYVGNNAAATDAAITDVVIRVGVRDLRGSGRFIVDFGNETGNRTVVIRQNGRLIVRSYVLEFGTASASTCRSTAGWSAAQNVVRVTVPKRCVENRVASWVTVVSKSATRTDRFYGELAVG